MVFGLLLLTVVLIIIRPQEFLAGLMNMPVVTMVLGGAGMFWVVGEKKDIRLPQLYLLALFVIALVLSELFSGHGYDMGYALVSMMPAWLLYMVTATTVTNSTRQTAVWWVIVISTAFVALHSIGQYLTGMGFTGMPVLLEHGVSRVRYLGIFSDPNDLGVLFVTVLPFIVYLLIQRRSFIAMSALLAMLVVILIALYMTKSRGALLALGVMGLLEFWRRRGGVQAVIVGAGALVLTLGLKLRPESITAGDESALGRIDAWEAGLQMFLSHPIFGVGYDHFTDHYTLTAHNSFVLVLAESGLVGYSLWVTFILMTLWMLYSVVREHGATSLKVDKTGSRALGGKTTSLDPGWILLLAVVGYASAGFFLSQTYVTYLYLLMGLATGYMLSVGEPATRDALIQSGWSQLGSMLWLAWLGVIGLFVVVKLLLIWAY